MSMLGVHVLPYVIPVHIFKDKSLQPLLGGAHEQYTIAILLGVTHRQKALLILIE